MKGIVGFLSDRKEGEKVDGINQEEYNDIVEMVSEIYSTGKNPLFAIKTYEDDPGYEDEDVLP